MRILFSALALATYLFLSSPQMALGDNIIFNWDKVTVDNTGAPLTELTGYKVYVSKTAGTYTASVATVTPVATGTVEAYTYVQNTIGKYFAVVTAYNSGGESAKSNEISFDVLAKLPGTPINFRKK